MAVVTPNMIALVTVKGTFLGQTTMNTYPYISTAVTGQPTIAAAMGALNTFLTGVGRLYEMQRRCAPANWANDENWCQVIRPVRYRKFTFIGQGPGLFTDVAALTANLQASIERYSEETGHHEQGGVRIPIGTDADSIVGGFITDGLREALEAHAEQMKFVVTAGGVTWAPVTGVTAPNYAPLRVFGTSVKETVRVARRRTVGLGI